MNLNTRLFLVLLSVLALLCGANRAQTALDDRENIAPTAWQMHSGQSFNDIGTMVAAGYRIVDIRIDTPQASSFTVTYVHNSGAYGTPWWYLIGVDATSLINFYTQNSARITRVIAWDNGSGGTAFAAVMVPNTGPNARPWWWYYGQSSTSFFNAALANGARPTSIDEYQVSGNSYMVGTMIPNAGVDYKPWGMYVGLTFADVGNVIAQNQARLWCLQQTANGLFNIVLVRDSTWLPWWYLVGVGEQQLLDFAGNAGARVFDLQNLGGSFAAILLRNDNDLERRVGDIMRANTDGMVGVYCKQVGGPTLAALQADRPFEPASTIKTLIHYHAMDQVRLGNASLAESLTVYTGSIGSCPQATSPVTQLLSPVLRSMMEASDNNRTLAAESRFGRANINATAQLLGMASTSINHTLGCGGPAANRLTLRDIGRLHEAVANGSLGARRTDFYDLMLEFPDNYAGGELNNVIAQEATAVGLSSNELASFRSQCRQAFKGGSYTFLGPTREFRSWASWISLPFYTSAGIVPREYVTGAFVDGASNGAGANTAFNRGAAEVLRGEIHAAMVTWNDHVYGSFTPFGTGCLGSNGIRPSHTGSPAAPYIGATVGWSVSSARPVALAALAIGFSNTQYGANLLPLDLGSLGMGGCRLYTDIVITPTTATSILGAATISATMPNDAGMIGMRLYSQYAVFDVGANTLGVAWSNALQLYLGGQP